MKKEENKMVKFVKVLFHYITQWSQQVKVVFQSKSSRRPNIVEVAEMIIDTDAIQHAAERA
jgi:hypothetical protein